MTPLSAFLPLILPFVHDCSNQAATITARFAAIEFCEKSDWLQYEVDPITVQAGIAAYEIEAPEDSLPMRIKSATILGQTIPLEAKTQDELARMYGEWREKTGSPRYMTQVNTNEVILVPSPTTRIAAGLRMIVTVRPTNDAASIDDDLFNRWAEPIGYGARARLMEMAGQPYYDPSNAPAAWKVFRQAISDAKAQRLRDIGRTVQSVQLRRFV